MRLTRTLMILGLTLTSLVALSIGTRHPLRAQPPVNAVVPVFVEGAFGGVGRTGESSPPPVYLPSPLMTLAESKTRLKLHEKIAMNFPIETPLDDVVKYIEKATIDQADFAEGISIYVDPQGLQDADKTMASTIAINLKNLPLETTLELVLKQLSLTYWINKDGLLIITAASEDLVTPGTLDREILSNLSRLRTEVQALRAELSHLRRGELPEIQSAGQPAQGKPGGLGGMM